MAADYYKYLIGHFLSPLSLLLTIIIFCFVLIVINKKVTFAKYTMGLALLTLYVFSTKIGSDLVLAPLEFQYPIYQQSNKNVDYIVVLGCASEFSPHLPTSSKLQGCSYIRLQEGLNIYKQNPNSHLILTGGAPNTENTISQTMQAAAINMGVKPQDITILDLAINTEQEAAQTAAIVVDSDIVLVTSASHMGRAMSLFASHGLTPTPAPTDFLIREVSDTWYLRYFIPEVANLEKVRSAFHEYYGRLWLKIKFDF